MKPTRKRIFSITQQGSNIQNIGRTKKHTNNSQQMLEGMNGKRNPHPLVDGIHSGLTFLEISVENS